MNSRFRMLLIILVTIVVCVGGVMLSTLLFDTQDVDPEYIVTLPDEPIGSNHQVLRSPSTNAPLDVNKDGRTHSSGGAESHSHVDSDVSDDIEAQYEAQSEKNELIIQDMIDNFPSDVTFFKEVLFDLELDGDAIMNASIEIGEQIQADVEGMSSHELHEAISDLTAFYAKYGIAY